MVLVRRAGGDTLILLAEDKEGRPLRLAAALRGGSLVVRAHRRERAGPEAVLIAAVEGPEATVRNISFSSGVPLSQGIGTALLRFAEDILRDKGVTGMVGFLSRADAGHRERQVGFYLKNGYTVDLRPDGTGRIDKSLTASPWIPNNWPAPRLVAGRLNAASSPALPGSGDASLTPEPSEATPAVLPQEEAGDPRDDVGQAPAEPGPEAEKDDEGRRDVDGQDPLE